MSITLYYVYTIQCSEFKLSMIKANSFHCSMSLTGVYYFMAFNQESCDSDLEKEEFNFNIKSFNILQSFIQSKLKLLSCKVKLESGFTL